MDNANPDRSSSSSQPVADDLIEDDSDARRMTVASGNRALSETISQSLTSTSPYKKSLRGMVEIETWNLDVVVFFLICAQLGARSERFDRAGDYLLTTVGLQGPGC